MMPSHMTVAKLDPNFPRSYRCDLCDESFKSENDLSKHIGEKPLTKPSLYYSLNIITLVRLLVIPSNCSVFLIVALLACLILFTASSFIALMDTSNIAFADGLFEEQLSASLGNRKADLLIKMNPPVVTTQTIIQGQKPTIEFRLFDSSTNQSLKHVTYFITIEKGDKKLLTNWFHDHIGDLRIQMNPRNTSQIVVYGEQDPILNAYSGTPQSPVVASGPIFQEGGLYHFIVQIATVDFDRTLIPDNQQPIYDGYLSVGNSQNYTIPMGGKEIPINIISYYDKLKDISYDNKNNKLKFDMPFNWNLSRIKNVKIFVHEEISIPKPSPFANQSYSGEVNGIPLPANMLMIDSTNSSKDVVHFMIPKDGLISIAENVNKNGNSTSGLMKFGLKPGSGAVETGNMTMNMNMSAMSSSLSGPNKNAEITINDVSSQKIN